MEVIAAFLAAVASLPRRLVDRIFYMKLARLAVENGCSIEVEESQLTKAVRFQITPNVEEIDPERVALSEATKAKRVRRGRKNRTSAPITATRNYDMQRRKGRR